MRISKSRCRGRMSWSLGWSIRGTARALFEILNLIVDALLVQPRRVDLMLGKLPQWEHFIITVLTGVSGR